VRHYYYRLIKRLNKILGPGSALDIKNPLQVHRSMIKFWEVVSLATSSQQAGCATIVPLVLWCAWGQYLLRQLALGPVPTTCLPACMPALPTARRPLTRA
jgi:hypothetical protein